MMPDLHKKVLLGVASGVVLGWFFTAFLFYPPHRDWGTGTHWGDVATWFSGTATLLAVCAAIGIPMWQEARRRREQEGHQARSAEILAIELIELLVRMRIALIDRRSILKAAVDGQYNANVAGLVTNVRLWGGDELPHGADLQNLPYPVAPSIAALRSMLAMYNGSLERAIALTNRMRVEDAVKQLKLPDMLDACQGALARVAGHLGKYDASYAPVDFLDAGNGTHVKILDDYGEVS